MSIPSRPPRALAHARPFLRWAGGKRWLAQRAAELLPGRFEKYFEPFLGSGAMYFAIEPPRAVLSDSNSRLITAFREVRDRCPVLSERLGRYAYSRREYYSVRSARPRTELGLAVQLLSLNRTCWNGLYRVNRQGGFNVPFGRSAGFSEANKESLGHASSALRGATLKAGDFATILKETRPGDFVYLDPPYTVTHGNNGFLLYNERIFSWADQSRLADAVRELDRRRVLFLMSNADHPSVAELYREFTTRRVTRSSVLAADSERRRTVGELLISNYLRVGEFEDHPSTGAPAS
jgi:DNA adenine methylase